MSRKILTDEILIEAVTLFTKDWLYKIPKPPAFKTSKKFNENMKNILNNQHIKHSNKFSVKLLILIAILVITITSLSVGAIREVIVDFFVSRFTYQDVIKHQNNEPLTTERFINKIENVYELSSIPMKYKKIEQNITETFVFTLYLSDDSQLVLEQYVNEYYKDYINNVGTDVKIKTVNDINYYITHQKELNQYKIVWKKYGYTFSLTSNLNENETIEICESLKPQTTNTR